MAKESSASTASLMRSKEPTFMERRRSRPSTKRSAALAEFVVMGRPYLSCMGLGKV